MSITELQKHQIRTALQNSSEVLNAIKRRKLTAKGLSSMKTLESAVQHLELFIVTCED